MPHVNYLLYKNNSNAPISIWQTDLGKGESLDETVGDSKEIMSVLH